MKKAFFAYPYNPLNSETISKTIEKINTDQSDVVVKSWEDLAISGRVLIDVICKEIRNSDLFCADLTDLNPNVLFELGYAIACQKKIWIVRDTTIPDYENNFKKLKILTTVGYVEYRSSADISKEFLKEKPYLDTETNIYEESIDPSLSEVSRETVFYLKSRFATDPSNAITTLLDDLTSKIDIQLIIDDPQESIAQPLSWYGLQVHRAAVVVCHFVNNQREAQSSHRLFRSSINKG